MEAPVKKEKPHLSTTQLEMLAGCGEAWRRRYEEGEKIPPGFALVRGRSVHAGAEMNFRQKITSGVDLPVSQIVDRAVAQVEAEVAQGVSLDADEVGTSLKVLRDETTDLVAKLARLHAMTQAPEYQPKEVEAAVLVILPQSTHDLKCVMDLITKDEEIVDLKTSGRAKTQKDADESIQLTAYHLARQSQTGKAPSGLALDVMQTSATTLKRVKLSTTRNQDDVNALGKRFTMATRAIQAGVFQPAQAGSWMCCRKYCGYFDTCDYTKGIRAKQGD